MKQYHDLLRKIIDEGVRKDDRTGTGTLSVFGPQMRFDLTKGFPLVTTKRVFWRGVVEELLWILSGSTNNNDLESKGVTIWREWARQDGELGPIYGAQIRAWKGGIKEIHLLGNEHYVERHYIDQIQNSIDLLRSDPESRRIVVSSWNVSDLPDMALAPCHCLFQFYTRPMTEQQRIEAAGIAVQEFLSHERLDELGVPSRYLDCQLYQRSCDSFLGLPFNIASYALLTHMIAREVNMVPGEFVWTGGDTHIYLNHIDQVITQLSREGRSLPEVRFVDGAPGIFDLTSDHIILDKYNPHPKIEAPVAI